MTSLNGVVTRMAASIEDKTVVIELICADAYAAQVVYEDVVARANSDEGLTLKLKVKPLEVLHGPDGCVR